MFDMGGKRSRDCSADSGKASARLAETGDDIAGIAADEFDCIFPEAVGVNVQRWSRPAIIVTVSGVVVLMDSVCPDTG